MMKKLIIGNLMIVLLLTLEYRIQHKPDQPSSYTFDAANADSIKACTFEGTPVGATSGMPVPVLSTVTPY